MGKITEEYVSQEVDKFIDTLKNDEEHVSMLLRFHLYTEHMLERILIAKLPKGHILVNSANLSYRNKLELVNALGVINDNLLGSLRVLNSVRNDCSHSLQISISQETIEKIGIPLGKKYIEIRTKHEKNLSDLILMTFSKIIGTLLWILGGVESQYDE